MTFIWDLIPRKKKTYYSGLLTETQNGTQTSYELSSHCALEMRGLAKLLSFLNTWLSHIDKEKKKKKNLDFGPF